MKRSCHSFAAVLVSVMSVGSAAQAQAPGQVPGAATAVFLEKRVPDELATEGIVLSRQGLELKVEQVGSQWLVSLVDLNTGRVAASTKVAELSPDREAAVATMTHIVAELASQISGRAPSVAPPVESAPGASSDLAAMVAREKTDRDARDAAELSFRRKAIHFGSELVIAATGHSVAVGTFMTIRQGELDQPMEAVDFYKAVNRPDLYARYQSRHNTGVGLTIAGWVLFGVAVGIETYQLVHLTSCANNTSLNTDAATTDDCFSTTPLYVALGLSTVATGLVFVGGYYRAHPHAIDEGEAKALADKYNQGLRKDLGLPVVSQREPVLRDVRLAPFAGVSGGGLALGGRF